MELNWYALRSKPRKEDTLWRQLLQMKMEVFYPRMRVYPVNPRSRKIKPYFPGYMFVRTDLAETGLSTFQWMPHAAGLVCFGGEPSAVPEHLILELRRRIGEVTQDGGELFHGLHQGDHVIIHSGPFNGYEALFDVRLPGSERVRVLLEFLGSHRLVPVELDASQIEKKKAR